jgi:hypothetical protein
MNNLKDTLKKYVRMTPQTFSYTMIGLSTAVLVFFIAYKDDDKPSNSDDKPSKSDDKPSKSDDELPEDKPLPEEDEEQFDFDKNEEPMRVGDSRMGDSRMGDSRMGDSRMGGTRSSRTSRASRALDKDKSKHGKNTNTRKKSNKKHK